MSWEVDSKCQFDSSSRTVHRNSHSPFALEFQTVYENQYLQYKLEEKTWREHFGHLLKPCHGPAVESHQLNG